jgi:hypothetical protein
MKIGLGNSNEMCLQGLNLSSTQNSAFHHDLALLQQALPVNADAFLRFIVPAIFWFL